MCKNLVEKGNLDKPLMIFNRTTKRATDLKEKLPSGKSIVVSSIDEAVSKSDIIFICLGDDPAVKDTIATAVKGNVKGKLFVDCSTIHPDTTNELAKLIEGHGAQFVACPGTHSHSVCYGLKLILYNQCLERPPGPRLVNWSVSSLVQRLPSRR